MNVLEVLRKSAAAIRAATDAALGGPGAAGTSAGPGAMRCGDSGVDVEGLVAALTATQELINTLSGVQIGLIGAIAHTQSEWDEEGLWHGIAWEPRLDTAGLIAGPLMMGAQGAGLRAEEAVWLAKVASPLVGAMVDGAVDRRRVDVIADELTGVDKQVAAQVVERVTGQVREGLAADRGSQAGIRLRRLVQSTLAHVDPESARLKMEEAANRRSLRRWVEGPGSDGWKAILPAAESAQAWAAIDERARRMVTDGDAATLEEARALAMVALVTGESTGSFEVRLVLPWPGPHATDDPGSQGGADGPRNPDGADGLRNPDGADGRSNPGGADGLRHPDAADGLRSPDAADGPDHAAASLAVKSQVASSTAARSSSAQLSAARTPSVGAGAFPEPGSGDAAFAPGATARREVDPETVARQVGEVLSGLSGLGPGVGMEVRGLGNPHPTFVTAGFVANALTDAATAGKVGLSWCHPVTGALIDPEGALTRQEYRPNDHLIEFVKARDGSCRFPGCHIPVRFCDIDHVRPWPTGPTSATNLMCLCRRHHRVKQLPGWQVGLAPDGCVTWVNPVGTVTTTYAVDHSDSAAPSPVVAAPSPVVAAPSPVVAARSPVVAARSPVVAARSPVVAARSTKKTGTQEMTGSEGESAAGADTRGEASARGARHRGQRIERALGRDEEFFTLGDQALEHALEHALAADAFDTEITRRRLVNRTRPPRRHLDTSEATVRHRLGFGGRWSATPHALAGTTRDPRRYVDLVRSPHPRFVIAIPDREPHDPPPF